MPDSPAQRLWTRARRLGASLAFLAASAALAQYGPVDPYESSIRVLRAGIQSRNDGRQHAAMVALRELRDPGSRELLLKLLKSDAVSLRIDSVLGLAEIDPSRKVDPALIEALPLENERALATRVALALELVDEAGVRRMLEWRNLTPAQRIALWCELRRLGGEPDRTELLGVLESNTPELMGVALALLLDLGAPEAEAATERVRGQIAALPPKARSELVGTIAQGCSINGLKGAAPFVASLLELPDIGGEARPLALGSLLVLDAERGLPVLARSIESDRSQLSLMRHGAILLASGSAAPASDWNRLRNGDSLIETIADAGVLLSASDHAGGYRKLVDLRHRVTLRAALEGARRLGTSADRALGLECLRVLEADRKRIDPLLESVMTAITRLAATAPEELRPALERAASDPPLQDMLLQSLCAAGTPEAAKVASIAAGKATRLGEALIAVLRARTDAEITASELQTLGNIAGGAVPVDPAVQVQAAWLWLRHANRLTAAVDVLAAANPADAAPDGKPGTTP